MWAPLQASAGPQGAMEQPPSAAQLLGLWEQQQQGMNNWTPGGSQNLPAPPADTGSPTATWSGNSPSGGSQVEHPAHSAAAKIYVQGLPQSLQHPVAVAGLFSPYGDVLDVKLYAAEVRLSGGSAVVRMRSHSQAGPAIAALNGIVPEGGWQQLTVRAAETAEQRSSRISAINGRQAGGPGSPMAPPALPPSGPGGAALRRVHSARSSGSHGALQCFTAGLASDGLSGLSLQMQPQHQRLSLDYMGAQHPHGSRESLDSSRRSSMDVTARSNSKASAANMMNMHMMNMMHGSSSGGGGGGRSSNSDSGSDEMAAAAPPARPNAGHHHNGNNGGGFVGGSNAAESNNAGAGVLPSGEMQRMLLEAVLALLGQVENGQLSLPSMRLALESALTAAKQGNNGGSEEPAHFQHSQHAHHAQQLAHHAQHAQHAHHRSQH